MLAPAASRDQRPQVSGQEFEVRELRERDWKFNREMYFKVGEQWRWIDKRPWTDQQWKNYANDPNLRTFGGYCGEEFAGYYELHRSICRATGEQKTEGRGQRFAGANFTAGGRELLANRSREAGDSVLVKSEIEIAYFGLLPEFIGRGLGGVLLTSAIETAWAWTPTPSRVWVHTCNRDHPSALANYQARGFEIYKTVTSDG